MPDNYSRLVETGDDIQIDVKSGKSVLRAFTWAQRAGGWLCSSDERLCKVLCEVGDEKVRVLKFEGNGIEARRIENQLRAEFAKKDITDKELNKVRGDPKLKHLEMAGEKFIIDVPRDEINVVDEETLTRHGIPLPLPLRYSILSDSIGYILMVCVVCVMLYAPVWIAHRDYVIPLSNTGTKLDISSRNCDLWFTEITEKTGFIRIRYWSMFGSSSQAEDNGVVRANVTMWSKQNWEYLACSVFAYLPAGFEFEHLRINTTNSKLSAFAADMPLRAARADFHLKNTRTSLMDGFESKSLSMRSQLGMVNLHFPRPAQLNLTFKGAASPLYVTSEVPVAIKGRKDTLLLQAPQVHEQGDSFALGVGEPTHRLDVNSDASVSVTMSPEKATAPKTTSLVEVDDLADVASRRMGDMQQYVGDQHLELHFGNRSDADLYGIKHWLDEHPNDPWVVQMQTTRPGLPQGVWTLAVTGSYLAMPLEYYSLLSFGMLTPRLKHINIDVFGAQTLQDLPEEEVQVKIYNLLLARTKKLPVGKLVRKRPGGGGGDSDHLKDIAKALGAEDDGPDWQETTMNFIDDGEHLFFRRPDGTMDVYSVIAKGHNNIVEHEKFQLQIHARMFVMASVLNFATSIILAFTICWLVQMGWPLFMRKYQLEQFNVMLTHRMQDHRIEKRRSWRLIVMMKHYPTHGIVLRWAKRPRMAEFRRLVFFVQARRPSQHQIRLSILAKDVPFNRYFPDQREFFISTEHGPGETRESLKVGYGYRAKVIAFDKNCMRMEESIWSSPVVLEPPRPFAATPLLLLKHCFPASRMFSSFEMFIKRHLILPRDVQLKMQVQLVQMLDITPQLIPDNYYVEVLLGTIRLTNDPRVYAKSPLFRLKQRKTMPEMEFEGQFKLNEEGSCVRPLEFSCNPETSNYRDLPGKEYPEKLGQDWWEPHEGWANQDDRFTKARRGSALALVNPHEFKLRNHRRLRLQIVNNSDGQVVAQGFRMVNRLLQEDWDPNQPTDGVRPRTAVVQTVVNLRKVGAEDEDGQHFCRIVFNFKLPEPDVPTSATSTPTEILFGGDVFNSVWQEGAERVIAWRRDVAKRNFEKFGSAENMRIRISLFGWPGIEDINACIKATAEELEDVVPDFGNAGSYPWIVSTAGEPPATAFFQLRMFGFAAGQAEKAVELGRTTPFLVNRTLTLASLETAYCSFCRLHGLKMEYLSSGAEGLLAIKDVNIGPALVQMSDNCRSPFPFEPLLWKMRAKCNSEASVMVTTSVAKDTSLIGQVRRADICLSHRLDPSNDYWIKEPLLSNDLDYSYILTEGIISALAPVLGIFHGILEKILRPYHLISVNKAIRFGFRRLFVKRLCEVVIFASQLFFFALPSSILLVLMIVLTQQKAQFEPQRERDPARVLAIMDAWFELYESLGHLSRMGYVACIGLLFYFCLAMLLFSVFSIKLTTVLPIRFQFMSLPGPYLLLDSSIKFVYSCTCLAVAIYAVCCALWFVLGSVVSPSNLPVGIFVVASLNIGRTVTVQLFGMRKKLKVIMAELIDNCLKLLLDQFFENHQDTMKKRAFAKDVKKQLARGFKSLNTKLQLHVADAHESAKQVQGKSEAGRISEALSRTSLKSSGSVDITADNEEMAWFYKLMAKAEVSVDLHIKELGLTLEDDGESNEKLANRDLQTDEVYDFDDPELRKRIKQMYDHSLMSAPSKVHLPSDLMNPVKLSSKIKESVERIVDGLITKERLEGYMKTKHLEIQELADETFESTFHKETDMAFLTDRMTTFVNERLPEYTRSATERMLDPSDPESYLAQTLAVVRSKDEFQKSHAEAVAEDSMHNSGEGRSTHFYDGVSWLADFLKQMSLLRDASLEWTKKEGKHHLRGPAPLREHLTGVMREYCWEGVDRPENIKISAVWHIISNILDGQHLWYSAFEFLICDKFLIKGCNDAGKQRLAERISKSFDQFSNGTGFLHSSAVVSAIQKVTNRGVWKGALTCLLSDMQLSLSLAGENKQFVKDEDVDKSRPSPETILEKWWNMFEKRKKKNEQMEGFIRRQAVYKILGLMVHPHLMCEHMEASEDEDVAEGEQEIMPLVRKASTKDSFQASGVPKNSLWQEAYREMLHKLEIRITPETETRIFNNNQNVGYMSPNDFKNSIDELARDGMWFTAFQSFLEDSRITLPQRTVRIIYQMADFQEKSVDGVVDCSILAQTLKLVLLQQGLWLEAVHVILKEMSVQVSKDDLQDVFDQENSLLNSMQKELGEGRKYLRGFIPYESILDVANGLGRKGLPLDSFVSLVHELHLTIPDSQLHEIFARMDVNQEFGITWSEFRSGFCLMMKDNLPENLLDGLGLSDRKIMEFVGATVVSLFLMFVFLQLACATLAQQNAFQTFMQSTLTILAAVAVKVESSVSELSIYKEQVTDLISHQLSLPHSVVNEHLRMRDTKGAQDSKEKKE